MLGYAKLENPERKSQEGQTGRASPDYADLSTIFAGVGNQAMLSMLGDQERQAPQGGLSLIDEFRQRYALAGGMLDAQSQAPRPSGGEPLADAMRAQFERQFGLPMDDVRIHRDSAEPAKFDAGAYTYGTDIFIGPGQEELLNHEMTHAAQQKLGQVRPTGMEHGMAVNRSPALEHSADIEAVARTMGTAAEPVVQCAPLALNYEQIGDEIPQRENPRFLPRLDGFERKVRGKLKLQSAARVSLKRHHIIPYNVMRLVFERIYQDKTTWNYIKESLLKAFDRQWGSVRSGDRSGYQQYQTQKKQRDDEDFDRELFTWFPGNLIVGPGNRNYDPGDAFDLEAAAARADADPKPKALFDLLIEINDELVTYLNNDDTDGLKRFLRGPQMQTFLRGKWSMDGTDYKWKKAQYEIP
ncbi:MAG TPA: DUF4157 domain-containing protein [Candidatus Agathobaculum merdigallinarum]|nr:DUF4157 domain-containing protein [Candidatus Agathobaculum merdigallinarum]